MESWFVSLISLGEGWHNYHHAFPWDYKAAELSMHFNQSASIIRFLQRIGLAYDLKTASPELVSDYFFLILLSWESLASTNHGRIENHITSSHQDSIDSPMLYTGL